MRLRRVRFTLWWLMVAVATGAILLATAMMIMRSRNFKRLATFHAAEEENCRYVLEARANDVEDALNDEKECLEHSERSTTIGTHSFWLDSASQARERAQQDRQQLDALAKQRAYHADLKERYEWASAHSWELIPLDPPEPQYPQFGEVPNSFVDPPMF